MVILKITRHKAAITDLPHYLKSVQLGTIILILSALLGMPIGAVSAVAQQAAPIPELIKIPAGRFFFGSNNFERHAAYNLDKTAYGSDITRQQAWYKAEKTRRVVTLASFSITKTPITNRQYAAFIAATGHPAPDVDEQTWQTYRLIHPYKKTRRHAWVNGKPPKGREDHPVVLVSHDDAYAYAGWLSKTTNKTWRLPAEQEWEKAARGTEGSQYPWGNIFDPNLLNSADKGPIDTTPVGQFPKGASPYGMLDAAGQVYEWTATPYIKGRVIVKGGSWDDKGCGICRPSARHTRPTILKHILIGFRLVTE